jgi:GNAT superfamily N-acetyltransferase
MDLGPEGAKQAWSRLVGLTVLDGFQVVVDPKSPIAPRGWIGILVVAETITASVPTPDLEQPVAAALADLTSHEATRPDVVVPRLPPTGATLGPAMLFYPSKRFSPTQIADVEQVSNDELAALFEAVAPDEIDESGMREITSWAIGSRSTTGVLAAVSGYRHWPNHVAHLSVLTHPAFRRQGHGRRVATAAIQRAMEEDLLPQWRARPAASQAVARSLGLVQLGAQFSLEPA